MQSTDLKIIEKLDDCYILLHRPSNRNLVYKECQAASTFTVNILQYLKVRSTLDHKNLFKLFSFHEENQSGKIALIYEHWAKTFEKEIEIRFKTQIHWTDQELLNTLEVLLWGLDSLHSSGLVHGNITKKSIIFSVDGFVRLADQFIDCSGIIRTPSQLFSEKNCYLCPETFDRIHGYISTKETDIWQLGMVILEACLLRSCLDLVDREQGKVDFAELNRRISEVEMLKSRSLGRLLRVMLDEKPERRGEIMGILKNQWPNEGDKRNDKNILRNSQVINVSLKVKPQKPLNEGISFKENINIQKSAMITNNKPSPIAAIGGNKENLERKIIETTPNQQKGQLKNEKYQEILQMLENYKSPFENTPENEKKSPQETENQAQEVYNNDSTAPLVTFFPMNRQIIGLEGIAEETEETQEDRDNKEEIDYYSRNLKTQAHFGVKSENNLEKNYYSQPQFANNENDYYWQRNDKNNQFAEKDVPENDGKTQQNIGNDSDFIKKAPLSDRNATPQDNNKLSELQSLFEKSRARTNEILNKGKQILNKNMDTSQEIDFSHQISNSIDKIERKNLLSNILYTNQDKYEGDVGKGDQREGFGVYYRANGQILYQGEWIGNLFHGTGILNNLEVRFLQEHLDYNNLNNIKNQWLKYEGEFSQGKKQGNGVLLLSNREYFQGCFKNDKIHGFGCFHCKNGSLVFAEWKDSRIVRLL